MLIKYKSEIKYLHLQLNAFEVFDPNILWCVVDRVDSNRQKIKSGQFKF